MLAAVHASATGRFVAAKLDSLTGPEVFRRLGTGDDGATERQSITLWHCSRVTVAMRRQTKKARNALRALISDLCN
jgi:hypothetical protein